MEPTWWTQPEQLDDDQKKVVALPTAGNHLIVGPPGSGKTNLLVLRASFLHKAGTKNIVVLSFQRVLREFLASGANNYAFSPDKIQTFMRWGISVLNDHGQKFEVKGDFEEIQTQLISRLNDLIGSGCAENRYDCILLDEAQDYSREQIDLVLALGKQVFAAGDSRQSIHNVNGAIERLTEVSTKSELKYHYRSGLKICRVADGVRDLIDHPDGLEANSNYDEETFPSSASSFECASLKEQVDRAIPEILTQLKAYPSGMIGIICPKRNDVEEVWSTVRSGPLQSSSQLQLYEDGYEAFQPGRRVVVTTLHGAKGLEFRALHLLAMEEVKKFPRQRNMTYTAITRAKTSLAIYHCGSLPGYLEKGLTSLNPTQTAPSLSELFKP